MDIDTFKEICIQHWKGDFPGRDVSESQFIIINDGFRAEVLFKLWETGKPSKKIFMETYKRSFKLNTICCCVTNPFDSTTRKANKSGRQLYKKLVAKVNEKKKK